VASPVRAQVEISNLLHEFLTNVDKPEMHARFWADDLIYTSASGVRRTKADIMKSMKEPSPPGPKPTYDAEDVVVRQYGDVAVLTFHLVQHGENDGKTETNHYLNTGTFVKRDGKWQAVAWQATKMAESSSKQ